MNDNLTKLNLRFERSKLLRTKIELKIDEIEWRGDENGRENLYYVQCVVWVSRLSKLG